MPLPSFTVTGNLYDVLGNITGGNLATIPTSAKVVFTPNIKGGWVKWDGDLHRILPVTAEVTADGIKYDDEPVTLLANDPGLSVENIKWEVLVKLNSIPGVAVPRDSVPKPFPIEAPTDGGTVDLGVVAPVAWSAATPIIQGPKGDSVDDVQLDGTELVGYVNGVEVGRVDLDTWVDPKVASEVEAQVPPVVASEVAEAVPPAVTSDIAARSLTVDEPVGGTVQFKLGGVNMGPPVTLPAATWSGVAGKPIVSLTEFGAIADGTYDPVTHAMTGTDNTAAINAALAVGKPVLIPPGYFYYSGALHTNVPGSGLVGSGKAASYLITDQSLDRHISVVEGTKNTKWTGFSMIGPHVNNGTTSNRALTVGVNGALTSASTSAWDASGTWIDDFATRGLCVGLHVAAADNVQFGIIETHETGDARAEPGAYGITCSGSRLRGRVLRAVNTTTRGRHALYYTGPANDCFVEVVEATGFDLAAIQNRATTGGGKRNGFGRGRFEDCNTNPGDSTLRAVVNFVCANDVAVAGAGGAQIGDYTTINCGGFPGPAVRNMPNSRCGTVQAFGHNGVFDTDHYGSHVYNSHNVELPLLVFISGFDSAGLNDTLFEPLVVTGSDNCYGGGVRMHSGAIFKYGVEAVNCTGLHVPNLTLDGTYERAVRWDGTTDLCAIDSITPVTEPTLGLIADASTGLRRSRAMRSLGYDMKEVTTGSIIDVTGYREIRLNYGSSTTVTNLTGLQQGVLIKLTALNANANLAASAGGAGELQLAGGVNLPLGTRQGFVVSGHVTGSGGSYTYRCIESNPKLPLSQLIADATGGITVGSVNVGHASDTTVTRVSAGRIAVEGVTVPVILTASASLNFPSVAAQSYQDLTITVTGAVLGDVVAISTPTAAVTAGVAFTAWVSAVDTVTVRAHNYTGSAVDPSAGTFRATIIR